MSDLDVLFPIPTGGRNADDMGLPSPIKPAPPEPIDAERAAYEAWAQAGPRGWSMRRWSGGDYYTAWAQAGWSAWQAGMAAGIERAAKAAEDCKPQMYRQVPRNLSL